jgi:hypothetical protein
MFVLSFLVLGGLVAAQVTARLAQGHFEEFRRLPYMPQEN